MYLYVLCPCMYADNGCTKTGSRCLDGSRFVFCLVLKFVAEVDQCVSLTAGVRDEWGESNSSRIGVLLLHCHCSVWSTASACFSADAFRALGCFCQLLTHAGEWQRLWEGSAVWNQHESRGCRCRCFSNHKVISLLWDLRYTSLCFRAFAFLYEADVCIILGIWMGSTA